MKKENFCGVELFWDDFYWSGESYHFPGVELQVNSENEESTKPCENQKKIWKEFIENYSTIYSKILNSVFSYYLELRPIYLQMGDDMAKLMPLVENESALENCFSLSSITISWPYDSTSVKLGLSYSCLWDEEHGLGVVLEGKEILKVGGADCAII